jgi:hypothetical protein
MAYIWVDNGLLMSNRGERIEFMRLLRGYREPLSQLVAKSVRVEMFRVSAQTFDRG